MHSPFISLSLLNFQNAIQIKRLFSLSLQYFPKGHFMSAWNVYDDLTDITAVRHYIEGQMEEYNVTPGVVRLDLILFRDAVEHICRIVRVISQVFHCPLALAPPLASPRPQRLITLHQKGQIYPPRLRLYIYIYTARDHITLTRLFAAKIYPYSLFFIKVERTAKGGREKKFTILQFYYIFFFMKTLNKATR